MVKSWAAIVDTVAKDPTRRKYISVRRWYESFPECVERREYSVGPGPLLVPMRKLERLEAGFTANKVPFFPLQEDLSEHPDD